MKQVTVQDINNKLDRNIVLAYHKTEKVVGQLVYNPYTGKYNIYKNGEVTWRDGNRDKVYVVARYNQIVGLKV